MRKELQARHLGDHGVSPCDRPCSRSLLAVAGGVAWGLPSAASRSRSPPGSRSRRSCCSSARRGAWLARLAPRPRRLAGRRSPGSRRRWSPSARCRWRSPSRCSASSPPTSPSSTRRSPGSAPGSGGAAAGAAAGGAAGALGGARVAAHLPRRRLPLEPRGLRLDRTCAGALPLSAWIGAYGISFLVVLANTAVALGRGSGGAGSRRPSASCRAAPRCCRSPAAGARARTAAETAASEAAGLGRAGAHPPAEHPEPRRLRTRGRSSRNYQQGLRPVARGLPARRRSWSGRRARPGPSPTAATPASRATSTALAARGCDVLFNSATRWASCSTTRPSCSPAAGRPRATTSATWCRSASTCPSAASSPSIDKLARNAGEFRPADEVPPAALGARADRHGDLLRGRLPRRGRRAGAARAPRSWSPSPTTPGTATPPPPGSTSAPPASAPPRTAGRCCAPRSPASRRWWGPTARSRPQIGVFEEGVIRARVAGRGGLTPYARAPWLPPLALLGLRRALLSSSPAGGEP